jgi:hypothetical protein
MKDQPKRQHGLVQSELPADASPLTATISVPNILRAEIGSAAKS